MLQKMQRDVSSKFYRVGTGGETSESSTEINSRNEVGSGHDLPATGSG